MLADGCLLVLADAAEQCAETALFAWAITGGNLASRVGVHQLCVRTLTESCQCDTV